MFKPPNENPAILAGSKWRGNYQISKHQFMDTFIHSQDGAGNYWLQMPMQLLRQYYCPDLKATVREFLLPTGQTYRHIALHV